MEYNGYLFSGNDPVAKIRRGEIVPLDGARMPLYLAAGGSFETWLESRAIDQHRPNSRILKKILRLTDSSDAAAVLRAHAATVTDNDWVQLEGKKRSPMTRFGSQRTPLRKLPCPAAFPATPGHMRKPSLPPSPRN